jgi:hypothetical protein
MTGYVFGMCDPFSDLFVETLNFRLFCNLFLELLFAISCVKLLGCNHTANAGSFIC